MSILKRTVYYDYTDGLVRFLDWARVITTQGAMVEPFMINNKLGVDIQAVDYDPEDEINRVDLIEIMDVHKEKETLSGGYALHGGTLIPRIGI